MKPFASSQEVPGHTAGKLADFKPSSTCREQQLHWVSMSCTDNDFAVRIHQTPFSVALDLATA